MEKAVGLADLMLHAYMLTQSGIPMLYSGDEIGQVNDYAYKENPLKVSGLQIPAQRSVLLGFGRETKSAGYGRGKDFQRYWINWRKSADRSRCLTHRLMCILMMYMRIPYSVFSEKETEKNSSESLISAVRTKLRGYRRTGVYQNLLTGKCAWK